MVVVVIVKVAEWSKAVADHWVKQSAMCLQVRTTCCDGSPGGRFPTARSAPRPRATDDFGMVSWAQQTEEASSNHFSASQLRGLEFKFRTAIVVWLTSLWQLEAWSWELDFISRPSSHH